MKKIILLLILTIAGFGSNEMFLELEFSKAEFNFDEYQNQAFGYHGEYDILTESNKLGLAVNVLLPPGTEANREDFELVFSDWTEVGNIPLSYAVESPLDNWKIVEYVNAPTQPEAEILEGGFMMGKAIAKVRVYPFRYVNGVLELAQKVHIQLNCESTLKEYVYPHQQSRESYERQKNTIRNIVINPDDLFQYQGITEIYEYDWTYYELYSEYVNSSVELPPAPGDLPVDLVIVTSQDFLGDFTFLMHENYHGLRTQIFTIEEISEVYYGTDPQEKMRNFLKDAYSYWGISALQIAGNFNLVPMRFMHLSFAGRPYETGSDLYFAALDGNCNSDGDHMYGENPEDDNMPEVMYARIPLDSSSDIINYKYKLYHHKYNISEEQTLKWMFLGASLTDTGSDIMGPERKSSILSSIDVPEGVEVIKLYSHSETTGGTAELTQDNFEAFVDQGVYFINHIDHGDRYVIWTGLRTGGDGLFIPEVDAMENAPMYPIIYSFSCDINSLHHENIAQHFLANPNGGAAAFIGNHATAWSASLVMDNYFVESFMANWQFGLGSVHLNQVLRLSTMRYASGIVGISGYVMNPVYMGNISRLLVEIPEITYGDSVINIRIGNEDGVVLDSAKVTVSTTDFNFVSQLTDTEGFVHIPFHVLRDTLIVTTSYPNCITKRDTVFVSPAENAVVSMRRITYEEDRLPINWIPESGEPGFFRVVFENPTSFTSEATSYRFTIPELSFGTGSYELTAIEPFDSLFSPEIPFQMDSSFVGIHSFSILIEYESERIDTFVFRAHGSSISMQGFKYQDSLNSRPDAGENGIIKARLYNPSISDIEYAKCTFVSDFLETIEDTIFLDTLKSHSFYELDLEVIIDSAYYGGELPISLHIDDALKREWDFELTIGSIRPPDSIWTSSDFDNISLQWIPITGTVRGYNIYRAEEIDGEYELLNTYPIWSTFYVDNGLPEMSVFYYQVSTVDSNFNESPYSSPVKGWTSLRIADGWPRLTMSGNKLYATPVAVDINHDHSLEVFCPGWDGALYGFYNDGREIVDSTLDTDPFFVIDTYNGAAHTAGHIWSSPAVGDLDLDGEMDFVLATRVEKNIYAHDSRGEILPGWPVLIDEGMMANPTVANIDDEPYPEVLINTDVMGLVVLNHDGTPYGDSIFLDPMDECRWSTYGFGLSSPSVGDIDGDGDIEIVVTGVNDSSAILYVFNDDGSRVDGFPKFFVGTGYSFYMSAALGNVDDNPDDLEIIVNGRLMGLCVFDHNGELLEGFPYPIEPDVINSPAIADIDDDGKCEIFVCGMEELVLIDDDGAPFPGWPKSVEIAGHASPVIADVDGDLSYDFLFVNGKGVYAYDMYGDQLTGYPLMTNHEVYSSPCISDIDNNGTWEIIIASYDAHIYVWETDAPAERAPWYTYNGNYARTGNIKDTIQYSINSDNLPFIPSEFGIESYPNPFNSTCIIATEEKSTYQIFDINARLIKDGYTETGAIKYTPDESVQSGILLIKINNGKREMIDKILYIK